MPISALQASSRIREVEASHRLQSGFPDCFDELLLLAWGGFFYTPYPGMHARPTKKKPGTNMGESGTFF